MEELMKKIICVLLGFLMVFSTIGYRYVNADDSSLFEDTVVLDGSSVYSKTADYSVAFNDGDATDEFDIYVTGDLSDVTISSLIEDSYYEKKSETQNEAEYFLTVSLKEGADLAGETHPFTFPITFTYDGIIPEDGTIKNYIIGHAGQVDSERDIRIRFVCPKMTDGPYNTIAQVEPNDTYTFSFSYDVQTLSLFNTLGDGLRFHLQGPVTQEDVGNSFAYVHVMPFDSKYFTSTVEKDENGYYFDLYRKADQPYSVDDEVTLLFYVNGVVGKDLVYEDSWEYQKAHYILKEGEYTVMEFDETVVPYKIDYIDAGIRNSNDEDIYHYYSDASGNAERAVLRPDEDFNLYLSIDNNGAGNLEGEVHYSFSASSMGSDPQTISIKEGVATDIFVKGNGGNSQYSIDFTVPEEAAGMYFFWGYELVDKEGNVVYQDNNARGLAIAGKRTAAVETTGDAAVKLAGESDIELDDSNYTSADITFEVNMTEPVSENGTAAFNITPEITLYDKDGNEVDSSNIHISSITLTLDVSEYFQAGDKVTVTHYAEDGTVKEVYKDLIVDNEGHITFTNTKGFSIFEISKSEETSVETDDDLYRVYGDNRYFTSVQAATYLKQILHADKLNAVVLTTGENFADALAGSYLANKNDAPVLLINGKAKNHNAVIDFINSNLRSEGTVYVLGGENAFPDTWLYGLRSSFTVDRIAGDNRYDTDIKILDKADFQGGDILVCVGKSEKKDSNGNYVYDNNGKRIDTAYADSLSASAVDLPILLVDQKKNFTDLQSFFLEKHKGNLNFFIIGGTNAVPDSIVQKLQEYGTVEKRLAGSNRYETSKLIAEEFFENPDKAVLAYGENFPDGLSGGPLAYQLNCPLILSVDHNKKKTFAADYMNENGILSGMVLGGTALLPDTVVQEIYHNENEVVANPEEIVPPQNTYKLAFIINGTLGDHSFFDSGKEGLDKITADFGDQIQTTYYELTYDNSTWYSKTEDIVSQDYDIIVAGTYDMLGYIGELAKEYPEKQFWFYDEVWNFDDPSGWAYYDTPNVYAMTFDPEEGSFFVGALAALADTKGKVAYMGGMDNAVLRQYYQGFMKGVKYVNGDIEVGQRWVNSFYDAAAGKDVASSLYAEGYDIVYAVAGSAGLGAFDAALDQEAGNYVIGVDSDMGGYFKSLGLNDKAERTLSSMRKDLGEALYRAAKRHLDGTLPYGTNEVLGFEEGCVEAVVNDSTKAILGEEKLAQFNQIVEDYKAGKIELN